MKKIYITILMAFLAIIIMSCSNSQLDSVGQTQVTDTIQSLSGKQLDVATARKYLINRWQMITFLEADNERLLKEIEAADSITEIPASFYGIKQRMESMGEEMLAALAPGQRNLLKAATPEEYKRAYKAMLEDKRKSTWEHELAHPHTYEFRNDGTVFQHYTVEDYESNFSCKWILKENSELWMLYNPSAAAAGHTTLDPNDTVRFVILYLNADSLSLKIKGKDGLEDWEQPRFKTVSSLLQK
jgi:hypothetical protein